MSPLRVRIAHPGGFHAAYTLAAALARAARDTELWTGYYHGAGRFARLAERLPGPLAAALAGRADPALAAARVRAAPLAELAYAIPSRFGLAAGAPTRWRDRLLDRANRRRAAADRPDVVIGFDGSCRDTLAAARAAGATTVLYQVIGHVRSGLALLAEEAARDPAFAEPGGLRVPAGRIRRCTEEALAADWVLAPSAYVRDTLLALGVAPSRILFLPFAVDTGRFAPPPDAIPGAKRPFRALFVGQIGQRKGVRHLLEAWRRLDLADAELVLRGPVTCDPAALAGLGATVRVLPALPYRRVHEAFRDADLFVFPSLHEGSAIVTYEAMAAGLPVIATANAGTMVRDGIEGRIVPIRDADALAAAIWALHRDPARRRAMGAAARARAQAFAPAALDRRVDDLLAFLAAGRAGAVDPPPPSLAVPPP